MPPINAPHDIGRPWMAKRAALLGAGLFLYNNGQVGLA